MSKTKIEWTDVTWNPTRGCSRVSPGCTNCYAEKQARRFAGKGGTYEGLLHSSGAWNGHIALIEDALDAPYRWRKPRRVFVDSMSDLFHERVPFEFVDKVFEAMITNPQHTFQILTKRPARMHEYMRSESWPRRVTIDKLPPRNIWLGVSAEDQERANERVPLLIETPAAVRFLSCEPLLGPIQFRKVPEFNKAGGAGRELLNRFWIIVGGESGLGVRRFDIGWARDIVAQCKTAGVPVFVKQLGASPTWDGCAGPDEHWPTGTHKVDGGRGYWEIQLRDRKGGDMSEWPGDLRVREFPR